ncbi:NAD(P)-dependent dehydrogenase, short-chain alcohol dehydrogenase family [Actinobaculum suis]|uniref:Glucose 1-dehydrogenase n=1 Tax=Actinobaculum suis TaxID=1657 RepID=A0A0K9ET99_9ACTO|nr:glucose 1-dehydrogenase [Actinobaculum suis]KMY23105.1 short-chain dehydrogenase [Actinobaculum suis]MDY5152825.1 glucose 1-dehydrogenase [Actinobaculum suis]SDE45454.1 NAD(P)-dependent dehydrogenase, short-chain alcohol dehydrogenase family [Actinobaculum suis]
MLLAGKVAIITGAGSGFGKSTALLFAQEGAKIAAVDLNLQAAQEVATQITQAGGEAIALQANVAEAEQVQNFVEETARTFGKIDILFNNAGTYVYGNAEQTDLEGWHTALEVNLSSVFYGVKYALPYLQETRGNIISTASAAGIIGFPAAVSYAASKGGVISLTRAVAVDYAAVGVRANCIAPGTGETGMTHDLLQDSSVKQGFLAPIPLQRLGQPEDVAQAALFLASDKASYLTGVVLPVDGGWTMS